MVVLLFCDKFYQFMEGLGIRADNGIMLPDFIITQIVSDLRDFIGERTDGIGPDGTPTASLTANPLYTVFVEKIQAIDKLSHERKEANQERVGDGYSGGRSGGVNRQ